MFIDETLSVNHFLDPLLLFLVSLLNIPFQRALLKYPVTLNLARHFVINSSSQKATLINPKSAELAEPILHFRNEIQNITFLENYSLILLI